MNIALNQTISEKKSKLHPIIWFLLFSCIYVLLKWTINSIVNIDNVLAGSLSETLSQERIKDVLTAKKKWAWIGFAFIPIAFSLRILITTALLSLTKFFTDLKLTFSDFLRIVLMSEFVFVVQMLVKAVMYWQNQHSLTLVDIQYFSPLSLIGLFDVQKLPAWSIYSLQTLNLFELAYIILLGILISKKAGIKATKSLEYSLFTYGTGLFVWLAFTTFLILNLY
jgi:hypothetical protein